MLNLDTLPQENAFQNPDPGIYVAKVAKAEMVKSKPNAEGVTSEYLKVVIDLLNDAGTTKVGTVFDSQFDSDKPLLQYKIGRFIKACGIPLSGQLELKDLAKIVVGKRLIVDVKIEKSEYQGKQQEKAVVDITTNEAYWHIDELAKVKGAKNTPQNIADIANAGTVEGATETPMEQTGSY